VSTFAALEEASDLRPLRALLIPPTAFADKWHGKPNEGVCVGLRLISFADTLTARAEAAVAARKLHPNDADRDLQIEAYNDALMAWCVARGTCDPNDREKAPDIWGGMPEDVVPIALSPFGMRFVFDALDTMAREESPIAPEITDSELVEIYEMLAYRIFRLHPVKEALVRRLLATIRDELLQVPPGPEELVGASANPLDG